MPIPVAFLLAAQAAQMIGTRAATKLSRKAAELEKREIEKQIQYTRLATADESLNAMVALRKNLGTQAAMFAARGISGPSTALFASESLGNFNADERMRKINQLMTESQLRSHQQISKINQRATDRAAWNTFYKNTANNISTNWDAYSQIGGNFNKGSK